MKLFLRILALVMLVALTFTVFVACNGKNNETEKNENKGGVEYYINYNNTKIELDKNAAPVLSALGAAKSTASLGDCGGFGTQTRYTYDDIVLYTVKNDDGEKIDQITFSNDSVETVKGICVGDSADDVIAKYGTPTDKSSTKIEYEKDSLLLKFGIEDGMVKSINFIRITIK